MWWGKLNRKSQVSNSIFFSGPEVANSCKHVFGINLRRDIAFVSDWLTKKWSSKLVLHFFEVCMKSRKFFNIIDFRL